MANASQEDSQNALSRPQRHLSRTPTTRKVPRFQLTAEERDASLSAALWKSAATVFNPDFDRRHLVNWPLSRDSTSAKPPHWRY